MPRAASPLRTPRGRRPACARVARLAGYTLLEVLVAATLLVLMGAGLLTLLNQGVRIWRTSENRGLAYERARAVLDRVAEDLRAAIVRAPGSQDAGWVRFVADAGPGGRQRVRFLRATASETSDSLLREGGKSLLERTPAVADGIADRAEAEAGLLAAPAGSMEVFYMFDPAPGGTALWRAFRTPAGGPGSLFIDRNVSEAAREEPAEEAFLAAFASRISGELLYVGFRFWGPTTNTWDEVPPLAEASETRESGPTSWWDSTRALLDLPGEPGLFSWRRVSGSLGDPTDDIFPERVEVTVVARGEYARAEVRLEAPLGEKDEAIRIAGPFELPEDPPDRFVRIDDEWIRIESSAPGALVVARGGRGERWTQPAKHEAGALVESGATFRRIVEIPSAGRASRDRVPSAGRPKGGRG